MVKKGSKQSTKKAKVSKVSAGSSYYFGDLKKEKIKDAPVYGWPGP